MLLLTRDLFQLNFIQVDMQGSRSIFQLLVLSSIRPVPVP